MRFAKMHGLGNDYILVDCTEQSVDGVDVPELARQVSDRHRGVGGDGLILMRSSSVADLGMEIYNADGGRAQICGNGIRCVARYALERGLTEANPMRIETDAGLRVARVSREGPGEGQVTVVMGEPCFHPRALPANYVGEHIRGAEFEVNGRLLAVSCVSVGNPHAVVFVGDFGGIDLQADGRTLSEHATFPEGINVHFVRLDGPGEITVRSWERGSGITQACGTGACAAAVLADTTYPARVHLPGGDLEIDWVRADAVKDSPQAELLERAGQAGAFEREAVLMTGPAETVFEGQWNAPLPKR